MPRTDRARIMRAYAYGADAPVSGWDEVQRQHRLRTTYWNALVEIDHWAREQREAILAPHAVGETDTERREARRLAARTPEVRDQLRTVDQAVTERVRLARQAAAANGLYWPNYLDVEASWRVARQGRNPLRFHRYVPHEGAIAFPTTNGMPVAALFAGDSRVQIDPVPPDTWDSRRQRRRQQRTILRIRVGSQGRAPLWCEVPIYLHRPLPPEGIHRVTYLTWRRVASRLRFQVSIVVELPVPAAHLADPAEGPLVAVDLCWRRLPDGGIRVGYWRGEDGEGGEIALPARWVAAMAQCDRIRGYRDSDDLTPEGGLEQLRARLSAWVDAQDPDTLPEWLRYARREWGRWRSHGRFAALALRWRGERFAGDEDGYTLIEAWRQRDKHLWEYEANQRDELLAERREIYRVIAAQLARRYRRLLLEDLDLRAFARRDGVDAGSDELVMVQTARRHQRVLAAPHVLRGALVNAFVREHGPEAVVRIDPAYTTQTCPGCGQVHEFDAARQLIVTCPACGETWDQDARACANLLGAA
ncbi:MAG: transposase [Actinobacteria bacterium]|nr:MAG: transposase [Actinomycetota bacterium]